MALIIGAATLVGPIRLSAQKSYKALWLPPSLHNIQDENLWQDNYSEITSYAATRGELKGTKWMIVCDRADTEVFDKPGGRVTRELAFKEGPFYVIAHNDKWVEIVKGKPIGKESANKIEGAYYGWVEKENMLMWSEGLRSASGIQKYVFILLRAADLRRVGKPDFKQADIYNTPDPAAQPYDNIRIYSFYNVLKREGSRYLIANLDDGKLPGIEAHIEDAIVGWVEVGNTTPWNTRVVLEPNFTDVGYSERKGNANFQIYGYEEARQAGLHARNGVRQTDGVKWQRDPVTVDAVELAKRDSRRFLGGVMRFPMLSRGKVDPKSPTFKSGVIGDVKLKDQSKANDGQIAAVCEVLKRTADDLNNVNIMFAIQGTSNMAPYKEDIISAAQDIGEAYAGTDAQLRYGGVVYHNITDAGPDGDDRGLVDVHPLNTSREAFADFLEGTEFANQKSDPNTNVPAAAYGIDQLLRKVNLNKDQSNILILIGSDADFQYNRTLREETFKGHRAAVSTRRLVESLAASNTQLFSVAITAEGKMGQNFLDFAHHLTSSSAVSVYNSTYANLPPEYISLVGRPKEPYLPISPDSPEEEVQLYIVDSPAPGGLTRPAEGKTINDLSSVIKRIGRTNYLYIKQNYALHRSYCIQGKRLEIDTTLSDNFNDVAAGSFTALVQQKLSQILQEVDISVDQLGERFQLFEEVHFPRQINGSEEPTMSYVLFMDDFETNRYIQDIKQIINEASRESSDRQRQAVVDVYASLYGFFTGETNREILAEKTISEITSLMFGMQNEGLQCPPSAEYYCNLQLNDILDETAISDVEIERLMTHFREVANRLENEVLSSDNEFVFRSRTGQNYYWVPLVDIY